VTLRADEPDPSVRLSARPDDAWFRLCQCEIPVDVLTAVVDGELVFGTHANAAVAARSGHRWSGRHPLGGPVDGVGADLNSDAGRALCEALLAWGASRGATRGYLRIHDDNHTTADLARGRWASCCTTARATSRQPSRVVAMPDGMLDGGDPLRPASPRCDRRSCG